MRSIKRADQLQAITAVPAGAGWPDLLTAGDGYLYSRQYSPSLRTWPISMRGWLPPAETLFFTDFTASSMVLYSDHGPEAGIVSGFYLPI